jgi:cobyrinic acid a,c-diamide synthase
MTSRTAAALALGCRRFDPEMNLAGVILNPVANARQEGVIRRAMEDEAGLPVLGAVPRLGFNLPERHMGLVPPQEHNRSADALLRAARGVAGYVDVDALWSLMSAAPPLPETEPPRGLYPDQPPSGPAATIGVVRDAAFGFYYPENLEALLNHGARLVFCSALEDEALPPMDALYLGGGFPETHAPRLAANQSFKDSVKRAADQGMPIYAECGGLMYLGRNLVVNGRPHAMAGVFDLDFVMQKKPQGHGYSHCRVVRENPFLPLGYEFKAHEFHYSRPEPAAGGRPLETAYQMLRGKGVVGDGGGLVYRNVLGTYHHVHCLSLDRWAPGLTAAARGAKVA